MASLLTPLPFHFLSLLSKLRLCSFFSISLRDFSLPSAILKVGQRDLILLLPHPPLTALLKDWFCVLDSELRTRPSWFPSSYIVLGKERGWCHDSHSLDMGVLDPELRLINSVQENEPPQTSVSSCLKSDIPRGKPRASVKVLPPPGARHGEGAIALTFLSTTNSFSAAVRLWISSSYLRKGRRRVGVGSRA